MTNDELLHVIADLANEWQTARKDTALVGRMPVSLSRLLDDLERGTRGDAKRCYCLSPQSGHDLICPARRN